ncbi:MAG: sigma factor-like helix-turn-helix DNA-binding protein [Thermoleophilaceae bacterium]
MSRQFWTSYFKEIGEVLGVSSAAVEQLRSHAVERLRRTLGTDPFPG